MTLFLDTSALVKRYIEEGTSSIVSSLMEEDAAWAASSICWAETRMALHRAGFGIDQPELFGVEWEQFDAVPVDGVCLARAAEIGCDHRIRTLDAVHLAAAQTLPPPLSFLTFDERQREAAVALGLEVV